MRSVVYVPRTPHGLIGWMLFGFQLLWLMMVWLIWYPTKWSAIGFYYMFKYLGIGLYYAFWVGPVWAAPRAYRGVLQLAMFRHQLSK